MLCILVSLYGIIYFVDVIAEVGSAVYISFPVRHYVSVAVLMLACLLWYASLLFGWLHEASLVHIVVWSVTGFSHTSYSAVAGVLYLAA